jgi:hypothetical protein
VGIRARGRTGAALLLYLGVVGGGMGDPDWEDFLDKLFIPALLTQ